MTLSVTIRFTACHFPPQRTMKIRLLPSLSSTKTQSWPAGLVVMMAVGTGHLVGRNQSRTLYTVITFPNLHAKFPYASSFSAFPLPCSLSPPPPPLLSFPSTFLDIRSSRDTQVTVFTALCTFLSLLFLTPLPSLSYPLHAHSSLCLITHRGLFYHGTH